MKKMKDKRRSETSKRIITIAVAVLVLIIIFFGYIRFTGLPTLKTQGAGACTWNGNIGTVVAPYSADNVSACVSDASSKNGDVVIQIPNSDTTWSTSVSVNMRTGFTNVTSLTIRGQNDCTLDAKGRPTACGTNIADFSLDFKGKDGKAFRLSHIRINGTSPEDTIDVDGDSKSWRFDHIFFDTVSPGSRIIFIHRTTAGDVTYGVIDHCYVLNVGMAFLHYQPNADGGNLEWMSPLGLGTADAFYLEDNTFRGNVGGVQMMGITDCNGPGKFVVRHNDFYNSGLGAHDAIVVSYRGVRKWEIYDNTFNYDIHGNCVVGYIRSGTGVFYNNIINDPNLVLCGSGVIVVIYRNLGGGGDPWNEACGTTSGKACLNSSSTYPRHCSTDADCGGFSGSCVNIDGASVSPDGYLCRDQIGTDGNSPQVSRPMLLWNNTKNGGPITVNTVGDSGNYMVADRDYCLSATTEPSSCNGVNTNYTSYSYPHPLVLLGTTSLAVSIVYPANTTYTTNVSGLNYTITNSTATSCKYSLNSGTTNTTIACGTNVTNLISNQGSNTWTVYVNGSDGNASRSSVTFFKDTINPLVKINNPTATTYTSSSVSIDIGMNEAGNCKYSLDGGATNITLTANSSNTGFTGTTASLGNANYLLNAYCNDAAGNMNNTSSASFTVDVSSPGTSDTGGSNGGSSGGGGGGGAASTTLSNTTNASLGTIGTLSGNETVNQSEQQPEAAGSSTNLSKAAQFISSVKNYLIIFAIVLILAIAIVWVVMARKARTERLRSEMFEQAVPDTTNVTSTDNFENQESSDTQ